MTIYPKKEKGKMNAFMNVQSEKIYPVIRNLAILLVVIGHILRILTSESALGYDVSNIIIDNTYKFIYLFHMPLFFALSGSVYMVCLKNNKYKIYYKYILKKFKRLIVPFFFVGITVVYPALKICGLIEMSLGSYILNGLIFANDTRHLWYLLVLFWIFVYFGFLNRGGVKTDREIIAFSLALFLFGRLFMPRILMMNTACYYQIFFVVGSILDMYCMQIKEFFLRHKYILFLLFAMLVIGVSIVTNILTEIFFGITGIIFVYGICMVFVQCSNIKIPLCINLINKYSFGIYLFHPMIIYVFVYCMMNKLHYFWISILSFLIAMTLSVFITYIIKRMRLGFLIGET